MKTEIRKNEDEKDIDRNVLILATLGSAHAQSNFDTSKIEGSYKMESTPGNHCFTESFRDAVKDRENRYEIFVKRNSTGRAINFYIHIDGSNEVRSEGATNINFNLNELGPNENAVLSRDGRTIRYELPTSGAAHTFNIDSDGIGTLTTIYGTCKMTREKD